MAGKSTRRGIFHRYLIPGVHNAHQPHLLRTSSVFVIAASTVLLFVVALGLQGLVIRSPSPQIGAVVASVLVELANHDREKSGVAELAVSPVLEKAAQMKADDMAAKGYFAHDSPEGIQPWHWFKKAGYEYAYAGENLAVFFTDSTEVEKAWMDSPLHRDNILGEQFTEIGIALAHGTFEGEETTFVVQMFGRPAPTDSPLRGETVAITEEETSIPGSPLEFEAEATVAGASAEVQETPVLQQQNAGNAPHPAWYVLSAPTTTLQYIYIVLASLIGAAIAFLFVAELRRLHVPSLIRGACLLALLAGLFWGGVGYFSGDLLIL